jgi:hypothetical protein
MTTVHHSPIRQLLALALVGVLALLLRTPLCSPKVCSMSGAKMAACEALGGDCCQAASTRASRSAAPVQVQAPPPSLVSLKVEEVAASLARRRGLREPLAAAAILQGVGLHTLLAVFLI